MGWADNYIVKLKDSTKASFRAKGNSMKGKIKNGELVTVIPIKRKLAKGDIVLCKVKGRQYLHLITAVKGDKYQISNNKGFVNGWISKTAIYGIYVRKEK